MNKIKFLSLSLVALLMACFTACENKYEAEHPAELVGTWTCLTNGYVEALVIKADGSALSTGYDGEDYWENVAGNIVVKNGTIKMTFEDGDNFEGHFDIVAGVAFSIYTEEGVRLTFNYCAEDLSEEVVGMWVSHNGATDEENDAAIMTFSDNGKLTFTGFSPMESDFVVKSEDDYKVVGDIMFITTQVDGVAMKNASRIVITPNASAYGDIMVNYVYRMGESVPTPTSFLRVKEGLNFTGQTYDYISAHVTNAKGKDEDFTILGHTFNIAKIGAGDFDMMLRSVLFCLDTDANSIKQHFLVDGVEGNIETPIAVDGNKVTIDYSDVNPALRKVDMYMFQSANDSQLHIYMPTASAVNYLANLEFVTLLTEGKINPDDSTAIEKFYTDMEARVESINVSMVFKARN